MATINTLDPRSSLDMLFDELQFTLVRLKADALTEVQALAAAFEAREPEWWSLLREEKQLQVALESASAQIDRADTALDAISDAVATYVKLEAKGNTSAPGLARYFGRARPSLFKRPILGNQLEAMRSWPSAMNASTNPPLQALASKLEAAITAADAAINVERNASQKLLDYRAGGPKRAFIDALNGLRKNTFGQLATIAHAQGLPNDFAESFFRRAPAPIEPSLAELERQIAAAETELTRLKAQRDARNNDEQRAKEDAERALNQSRLDAAKKAAEEANAVVAELTAKLSK